MNPKDEYNLLMPRRLFKAINKFRFDKCNEEETNVSFSKACTILMAHALDDVLYEEVQDER